MEYTAIGNTVNIAARVQHLAHNQIFITEETYHFVRDKIEAVSLGKKQLRNIVKPVEVFEVRKTVKTFL